MIQLSVLSDILVFANVVGDSEAPVSWVRVIGKIVIFLVVLFCGSAVSAWIPSFFGDPFGTYRDEYGNELPTFANGCSGCLFAIGLIAAIAAAANWL